MHNELTCSTCFGSGSDGAGTCPTCRGEGVAICGCCRDRRDERGDVPVVPAVGIVDGLPLCRACLEREAADAESAYRTAREEWSTAHRGRFARRLVDEAYKRMQARAAERDALRGLVQKLPANDAPDAPRKAARRPAQTLTADQRRRVRSLVADEGYTRAQAVAWVLAFEPPASATA